MRDFRGIRLVNHGKRLALFCLVTVVALLSAGLATGKKERTVTADALAGRVLVVGFAGRELGDRGLRRTLGQIRRGEIAGVMFLRRNVRDEAQVKRLTAAFQEATRRLPVLIALDQEGGRVARLGRRSGFPRAPSAFRVAEGLSLREARVLYARMAHGLRRWGFNVNFGPVVDLHQDSNPIIGRLGRAFAAEPEEVAAYGRAFAEAHLANGVLPAIKHFPGHGSSTRDTHKGTVDVTGTWRAKELRPFAALVPDVPIVMTGHMVNRTLGGDVPATFSDRILTDLLRGRLGFRGVVVSDDLQMDAIADRTGEERAAELAMRAGVDLLLFSGDRKDDLTLVRRVSRHLALTARADPAFRRRLREAAERVDVLRRWLGKGS